MSINSLQVTLSSFSSISSVIFNVIAITYLLVTSRIICNLRTSPNVMRFFFAKEMLGLSITLKIILFFNGILYRDLEEDIYSSKCLLRIRFLIHSSSLVFLLAVVLSLIPPSIIKFTISLDTLQTAP